MRLDRQYDAPETSELDVNDLAPRIKSLKTEIDDLETSRAEIVQRMRDARVCLSLAPRTAVSGRGAHGRGPAPVRQLQNLPFLEGTVVYPKLIHDPVQLAPLKIPARPPVVANRR